MASEQMKLYWPIGLSKSMHGRTDRGDLLDERLNEYTRHVMGPDVTVTIGWLARTTGVLTSTYLGMINDMYVVNDILRKQEEGYDGAIVGGHWDPGLYAAREAASIPVAGPGESAMLMAGTLGRKFAMLTVMDGYVPVIENNIRTYGLEANAISNRPVRKFGMTYENFVECLEGKSDQFLVEFEKAALECIADGADIIIAGGQLFGPAFVKHGFTKIANTGVPVMETTSCGLKFAQTLVSLKRSIGLEKSQHIHARFKTPPQDALTNVRSEFLRNFG
ncbi:MAG TPA: aspartate/glutamate racemase family protein [Burkholderiaceae bacterium]|nr:aspartate/glutamate racemase family protein [Burkholderiaceae bacterium]